MSIKLASAAAFFAIGFALQAHAADPSVDLGSLNSDYKLPNGSAAIFDIYSTPAVELATVTALAGGQELLQAASPYYDFYDNYDISLSFTVPKAESLDIGVSSGDFAGPLYSLRLFDGGTLVGQATATYADYVNNGYASELNLLNIVAEPGSSYTLETQGGGQAQLDGLEYYTHAEGAIEATASAAPEPTSWALTMLGLGGVGAFLRIRRRKQAICAKPYSA